MQNHTHLFIYTLSQRTQCFFSSILHDRSSIFQQGLNKRNCPSLLRNKTKHILAKKSINLLIVISRTDHSEVRLCLLSSPLNNHGRNNAHTVQKKKKNASNTLQFSFICAGKQQRSYFRNEAIRQIQNEHNPPINQHMAMSFACLWITNLWGEFLQMEFSMPCALCFKHSKQTNKQKHRGSRVTSAAFPSTPTSPESLSDDRQLIDGGCAGRDCALP